MTDLNDLKQLVCAHYDLSVVKITSLTTKVFKVTCPENVYLFKMTNGDESFVMKQLYAYKELPENVLPIYKTQSGESLIRFNDGFGYLTAYLEQIPMPFEKRVHEYATLLQKLHTTTALHVEKHDQDIRLMYESDYQRLKTNFILLENYMQNIEIKASRSPFEWYVMMTYPFLYGMYRRADDVMQKFYQQLSKKKKMPVAMIHGDVNVANVLSAAKRSYLINFEKSRFDIPTNDIVTFLSHYHQTPGVSHIIVNYLKHQKEELISYDFFMRTLCVDLESLFKTLSGNSLIDISLLNEKMASGTLAMQIHDELLTQKKTSKQAKSNEKPAEEKEAEKTSD